MIMGQGKTTVIAPMLALFLADKTRLVMQVVPGKLLEMSRDVMRQLFSVVIPKRVYTLSFGRRGGRNLKTIQALRDKLLGARDSGSIVVSSPDAVKSLMLKYIELLASVESVSPLLAVPVADMSKSLKKTATTKKGGKRRISKSAKKAAKKAANDASGSRKRLLADMARKATNEGSMADALAEIIRLFGKAERGVALLDEVDMLLHPLRSELNFPIGQYRPLDCGSLRYSLPMFLLDAIFWCKDPPEQPCSNSFRPDVDSISALNEIKVAVKRGLENRSLSFSPHLSLLDKEFYAMLPDDGKLSMQQAFAKWAVQWLVGQEYLSVNGLKIPMSTQLQVAEDFVADSKFGAEQTAVLDALSLKTMKALNLAREWVTM
jgi:hypothetical protein